MKVGIKLKNAVYRNAGKLVSNNARLEKKREDAEAQRKGADRAAARRILDKEKAIALVQQQNEALKVTVTFAPSALAVNDVPTAVSGRGVDEGKLAAALDASTNKEVEEVPDAITTATHEACFPPVTTFASVLDSNGSSPPHCSLTEKTEIDATTKESSFVHAEIAATPVFVPENCPVVSDSAATQSREVMSSFITFVHQESLESLKSGSKNVAEDGACSTRAMPWSRTCVALVFSLMCVLVSVAFATLACGGIDDVARVELDSSSVGSAQLDVGTKGAAFGFVASISSPITIFGDVCAFDHVAVGFASPNVEYPPEFQRVGIDDVAGVELCLNEIAAVSYVRVPADQNGGRFPVRRD